MKKKIIAIALCAALAVGGVVAGSLAFFTDTDTVTNNFTVGDIQIELDEAKVGADGQEITGEGAARVKENTYKLYPGKSYDKDPTVHIEADSENCYVFVTVKNDIAALECDETGCPKIADQMAAKGWHNLGVQKAGLDVYVYCGTATQDHTEGVIVPQSTSETDLVVFEQFKIDGEKVIGSGELNADGTVPNGKVFLGDYAPVMDAEGNVTSEKLVTVQAYAVQSEGFADALAAWNATFGKTTA